MNKFGYKPFIINLYFNASQYYPTLDIVNTPTTRKKRQICQMTTQGFSKEYKLTVDASDVGVGAAWMKCSSTCFKDNNKVSHFFSIAD
jgi:hypothetical protein